MWACCGSKPESLVFVARGRACRGEIHIKPCDEFMIMRKGEMRLHDRIPEGKEAVAMLPEGSSFAVTAPA